MGNFNNEWEKVREKGKLNYVLKYGIILWGVVGLISALIVELIDNKFTLHGYFTRDLASEMLVRGIFYAIIIGPIIGLFMWNYNEKKYKKYNSKKLS